MKRPSIINMTLTSFKQTHKPQQSTPSLVSPELPNKSPVSRDKQQMQQLLLFVKLVSQSRNKLQNRDKKCKKQETINLPLQICQTVQSLIRKYLLFRTEQRTDAARGKPKLTHDRNNTFRALLRPNKQNQSHHHQEDQASPFRNMAIQQYDRQRLITRNKQLQSQLHDLRQRLKQKNEVIGKLVGKEGQLRRKFNEELSRLVRNRNIYNISANFEREEEEGQGRMALNIAGKTITQPYTPEEQRISAYTKSQQTPLLKTLQKSESYYKDNNRPKLNKTKKMHAFRPSKPSPSVNSRFLKNMKKSLPTECISRRQDGSHRMDFTSQKFTLDQERPTFQLQDNQLESTPLLKQHQPCPKKSPMNRVKDQQFQTLQMNGFYDDQTIKQMDTKLKL